MWTTTLPAQNDCFLLPPTSFSCLIALVGNSSTMLNSKGVIWDPCLVLDLNRVASKISPPHIMSAVDF